MTLLLRESDVQAVLTMPDVVAAVEESFRRQADGRAILHCRQRLHAPNKSFLHYMAAADNVSGYMAMKIYTSVRGSLRFLVPLYRAASGELLALIEAGFLGQMRTGAASGVATKYMARADAATAGVIGAGGQARTQLEAVATVRRLTRARVFSRTADSRAAFAREMSARLSLPVEAVDSAEEAVRGADVVVTATTSSRPVVLGRWLAPGAHINAIGANFPQKRELDDEAVHRAGIIAVDSRQQSQEEAGDLIQALGDDQGRWSAVRELAAIVADSTRGRTDARQITLFKSNGIATWDLAVATLVYERAVARGLGQKLALWDSPV